MNVQGLTALVTGVSRGLGRALAIELAKKGARVVLVARDAVAVEAVAAMIRSEGGEAHALAYDVANKEHALAIAGASAALVGPVDLVVHNASSLGRVPLPLLLDTDCEDLEAVLATNVIGPFRITKALAGSMALRGEGLVVNISSDAAIDTYPRWGAYSASKAALDHLGRVWAAELAEFGVRVIAFDPGEMDTKMHADAVPDADRATLADPREVARKLVRVIETASSLPTGARVKASDVATKEVAS
jgi:NAD(P)-dependent dehydrogenase (short-subunit alcohol dehydrogenase family)